MFGHQDIKNIVSSFATGQETRPLDWINKLVVHHAAIEWTGGDIISTLKTEANYQNNKSILNSHGLQYHFIIDVDGTIYQTSNLETLCWHAGDYPTNQHSLAVCLEGNFDNQTLTDAARKALDNLIWMLSTNAPSDFTQLKNINTYDGNSLFGHREIIATACPGTNVAPIITNARTTKMQSEIDYFNSKNPTPTPQPSTVHFKVLVKDGSNMNTIYDGQDNDDHSNPVWNTLKDAVSNKYLEAHRIINDQDVETVTLDVATIIDTFTNTITGLMNAQTDLQNKLTTTGGQITELTNQNQQLSDTLKTSMVQLDNDENTVIPGLKTQINDLQKALDAAKLANEVGKTSVGENPIIGFLIYMFDKLFHRN